MERTLIKWTAENDQLPFATERKEKKRKEKKIRLYTVVG